MKELLEFLDKEIASFTTDAKAQLQKGNKAAGTRARKSALVLMGKLKEFRKVSVDFSKNVKKEK